MPGTFAAPVPGIAAYLPVALKKRSYQFKYSKKVLAAGEIWYNRYRLLKDCL